MNTTYTIDDLRTEGPPIAMAMLLSCLRRPASRVTYGEIRVALEQKLRVKRIFPTQIGHVAGTLIDMVLEKYPEAPLLNMLITRENGIPGKGVAQYLAKRYQIRWNTLSSAKKLDIVQREYKFIQSYPRWEEISKVLFGNTVLCPVPPSVESDYPRQDRGGEAESEEHKALKAWVAADPTRIGLSKNFGLGEPEVKLPSGDEVDVMFSNKLTFKAVEVKSIRSGDEDLKRGIYQCVKYREVKIAEMRPLNANVEAILVTERKLPPQLLARAKLLGVRCKCVPEKRTD